MIGISLVFYLFLRLTFEFSRLSGASSHANIVYITAVSGKRENSKRNPGSGEGPGTKARN